MGGVLRFGTAADMQLPKGLVAAETGFDHRLAITGELGIPDPKVDRVPALGPQRQRDVGGTDEGCGEEHLPPQIPGLVGKQPPLAGLVLLRNGAWWLSDSQIGDIAGPARVRRSGFRHNVERVTQQENGPNHR